MLEDCCPYKKKRHQEQACMEERTCGDTVTGCCLQAKNESRHV